MDLRKLRHMLMLTEELNFVRAAAKLNLTQPALSRSIRALEEELNCQLFDRDSQSVRVTAMGQAVAKRARALLLDARSLRQEVEMLLRCEFGNLKFGAGPLPFAVLLPSVCAELAHEHPRLLVEVENRSATELLQLLLAGDIEFFVADVGSLVVDQRISVCHLLYQESRLFCRRGHPLAQEQALPITRLLNYPLVSGRRAPSAEAAMARAFGLDDSQPLPVHLTTDNLALLIEVTRASDAVLLATRDAVRSALESGDLVDVELSAPLGRFADVSIVSLAGWTLSPAAQWVIERLQAAVLKRGEPAQ